MYKVYRQIKIRKPMVVDGRAVLQTATVNLGTGKDWGFNDSFEDEHTFYDFKGIAPQVVALTDGEADEYDAVEAYSNRTTFEQFKAFKEAKNAQAQTINDLKGGEKKLAKTIKLATVKGKVKKQDEIPQEYKIFLNEAGTKQIKTLHDFYKKGLTLQEVKELAKGEK